MSKNNHVLFSHITNLLCTIYSQLMYFLCFFLDTHLSKLTFCLRITARSDHPLLCSILEVLWIESYGINRGDGLQREEWRGNEHKVENLSIHIHTHMLSLGIGNDLSQGLDSQLLGTNKSNNLIGRNHALNQHVGLHHYLTKSISVWD